MSASKITLDSTIDFKASVDMRLSPNEITERLIPLNRQDFEGDTCIEVSPGYGQK